MNCPAHYAALRFPALSSNVKCLVPYPTLFPVTCPVLCFVPCPIPPALPGLLCALFTQPSNVDAARSSHILLCSVPSALPCPTFWHLLCPVLHPLAGPILCPSLRPSHRQQFAQSILHTGLHADFSTTIFLLP
jgi:hypothetical protein